MNSLRDKACETLVTFFGLGHAPVAPGTFGTLGGVAIAAAVGNYCPENYLVSVLGIALALCLLGAPCGAWAEQKWGKKDPGQYVLDEVVGYLIAAAWPVFPGWTHPIAAFLMFRLTDIVKPPPARRMEKISGGWGILADDIVAGVWALLLLLGVSFLFPTLLGS